MYRRKTVEALLRQAAREKETLLATISEQNDRIMYLAGRQFAPTPLDMHSFNEPVEDEDELVDVGQLPDSLGADPY